MTAEEALAEALREHGDIIGMRDGPDKIARDILAALSAAGYEVVSKEFADNSRKLAAEVLRLYGIEPDAQRNG